MTRALTGIQSRTRSFVVIAATAVAAAAPTRAQQALSPVPAGRGYVGFDRNEYPGDAALPALRQHLAFTGYWLNDPPGARSNGWLGKREILRQQGFGFLVLANGKLDKQIRASRMPAAALGAKDADAAVAVAEREHFPPKTILFLDQEEGGRLLPEQMAYLIAWTETVARGGYLPGVYTSGQAVPDGPGKTITTAQDIREHVTAQHLHEIALWVYQDACPPAPGCVLEPPPLSGSGSPGAIVWQYAQSPRRRENTAACAKTYAADGNCYAGDGHASSGGHRPLDLNVAASPDPSHGR